MVSNFGYCVVIILLCRCYCVVYYFIICFCANFVTNRNEYIKKPLGGGVHHPAPSITLNDAAVWTWIWKRVYL